MFALLIALDTKLKSIPCYRQYGAQDFDRPLSAGKDEVDVFARASGSVVTQLHGKTPLIA
jgi:hypothetical protein